MNLAQEFSIATTTLLGASWVVIYFQWRQNTVQKKLITQQTIQISSEQRRSRANEERYNTLFAHFLVALWNWTYFEELCSHYKEQTENSRHREEVLENELTAERRRGSLLAFLESLLSRLIPVPGRAG